jgi:hypothetical protein
MARSSKPALTNYRPVRYSHIKIRAGADYVLTADPWSYLHGFLIQASNTKRGTNRKNFERAIFYTDLAQEFYKGADVVDLPTKATLLYYGMLNLVKAYLSVSGVELETTYEHHGVTLPIGKKEMEISAEANTSRNIFADFSNLLGFSIKQKTSASLKEAFKNIPEIHAVYQAKYVGEKQKFLPIDISFLTNETNKQLWTELKYEKKREGLVKFDKIYKGPRKKYFCSPEADGDWLVLSSNSVRRPKHFSKLDQMYWAILQEYSEFNIASLLTPRGYFYYCDLEPGQFHHLSYTLLAMFYMGSAARYRPSETKEILGGDMRQLATEATALCPKQFLYQITSLITQNLCVLPYASI